MTQQRRKPRAFSAEEDAIILRDWHTEPQGEIAIRLGRHRCSVINRAKLLGLRLRDGGGSHRADLAELDPVVTALLRAGKTTNEIAVKIGLSRSATRARIALLRPRAKPATPAAAMRMARPDWFDRARDDLMAGR